VRPAGDFMVMEKGSLAAIPGMKNFTNQMCSISLTGQICGVYEGLVAVAGCGVRNSLAHNNRKVKTQM